MIHTVQKFARTDPWAHIPFHDETKKAEGYRTADKWVGWVCVVAAVVVIYFTNTP